MLYSGAVLGTERETPEIKHAAKERANDYDDYITCDWTYLVEQCHEPLMLRKRPPVLLIHGA
ncbi:hypothetical protein RAB80_014558 [Fusarium oxysporum f. sp. vasinfectum]|nr:hypothetical protein RAB80_014558 [Fusarium oxysporum f. sp. vasinfectum]